MFFIMDLLIFFFICCIWCPGQIHRECQHPSSCGFAIFHCRLEGTQTERPWMLHDPAHDYRSTFSLWHLGPCRWYLHRQRSEPHLALHSSVHHVDSLGVYILLHLAKRPRSTPAGGGAGAGAAATTGAGAATGLGEGLAATGVGTAAVVGWVGVGRCVLYRDYFFNRFHLRHFVPLFHDFGWFRWGFFWWTQVQAA